MQAYAGQDANLNEVTVCFEDDDRDDNTILIQTAYTNNDHVIQGVHFLNFWIDRAGLIAMFGEDAVLSEESNAREDYANYLHDSEIDMRVKEARL